jgi:hypothetical protein
LEAAVKAAYIYRFLEYVSWPPESLKSPADPIVIGVTQDDQVTAELQRIARERLAQNRKLAVHLVKQVRDPAVHVLFVAAPDAPRVFKAMSPSQPVLTVTDARDGLERGATIALVESEGRIRFEVSLEAAHRAGLNVSARLLAIALRVKKGEYRVPIYALLTPDPVAAGSATGERRGTRRLAAVHFVQQRSATGR